jgi:hypothetical protein
VFLIYWDFPFLFGKLKKFGGASSGPIIFMRTLYKQFGDWYPLLAHEMKHSEQFYKLPIIHWFLYFWSAKYRLQCEAEAYAQSLSFVLGNFNQFELMKTRYLDSLENKYKLPYSRQEIEWVLDKEISKLQTGA